MKKMFLCMVGVSLLVLVSCVSTQKTTSIITFEVTREVTRIISVTPKPSYTYTIPIPTTTPTHSCYDDAITQYDLDKCAFENVDKQKSLLKALIIELKEKMTSQEYDKLLLVQNEWEKLVEDHCNWAASFYEGASMAPMIYGTCIEYEYKQRIDELRYYLCDDIGNECEDSLRYKQ